MDEIIPQPGEPPSVDGEYRYQAFISYRHIEPDRRWAKWLHSALESYRVPKQLGKTQIPSRRIGRIFRDEEELPASADLSQEIERALAESRFLIVICSPRTPESEWVNKEVIRFRELGRGDRILALLIEGEPSESFPRALREIRRSIAGPDGQLVEKVDEVEPLAADVRKSRPESRRYLRRMAKLRLLTCLLGCRFDDLRQREQERRLWRLTVLGAGLALLSAALMGLSGVAIYERRVAEIRRLDAERLTAQSNNRLVRQYNANGQRLIDAGDWLGGLPWHVEALKVEKDDLAANVHRTRLKLLLDHVPRLEQCWPLDNVLDVSFSPDGQLVAVGCGNHEAQLWNATSGKRHLAPLQHDDPVTKVLFSPNGELLATVAGDRTGRRGPGSLRVWEIATGKLLWLLRHQPRDDRPIPPEDPEANPGFVIAHAGVILAADWSSDGTKVVTGSDDQTARVWDVTNGKQIGEPISHEDNVVSADFGPGDETVLTVSKEQARIFNLATLKILHQFKIDGYSRKAIYSPDGAHILTVGHNAAQVWNTDTGEEGVALREEGWIEDATFSPDSKRVIVARGKDSTARIWDLRDMNWISPPLPAPGLTAVGFFPDGSRAFTRGYEFRAWDVKSGESISPPLPAGGAISPNGRRLATGDQVWNLTTDQPTIAPAWSVGGTTTLSQSPNCRFLVKTEGNQAAVWDALTGQRTTTIVRFDLPLISATFDSGGALVAYCLGDSYPYPADDPNHPGEVRIWDIHGDKPAGAPLSHPRTVRCATFSPDRRTIATGSDDNRVRQWNVASGKLIGAPLEHLASITSIAFDRDGARLLTTCGGQNLWSGNGEARVWDAASGKPISAPMVCLGTIERGWFSPDGRRVVTRSKRMKGDTQHVLAQIWESVSGKAVGEPIKRASNCWFSSDSRMVCVGRQVNDLTTGAIVKEFDSSVIDASLTENRKLVLTADWRVRDALSGKPVAPALSTIGQPTKAAFCPDRPLLAIGTAMRTERGVLDRHTVQIWDPGTSEAISPRFAFDVPISNLTFTPTGDRLIVVGHDVSRAAIWSIDLTPDARPISTLHSLAQAFSGYQIDPFGSYVPAVRRIAWVGLGSQAALDLKFDQRLAARFYERLAARGESSHEPSTARWSLQQLVFMQPTAETLLRLGQSEQSLKNQQAARNYFGRAIDLGTDNPQAWVGRGDALAAMGEWPQAIADYDRSISLKSVDRDAFMKLAIAQAQTGATEQASQTLARQFDLYADPVPEQVLGRKIIELEEANAWPGAELLLSYLLGRNPTGLTIPGTEVAFDRAQSLYHRGYARLQQRRFADSLVDFTDALREQPDWPDVLRLRMHVYVQLQQWPQAASDMAHNIKFRGDEATAADYYIRALLALAAHDRDGYQETTAAMLKRFCDSEVGADLRLLVKACVLNSDGPNVTSVADRAAKGNPDDRLAGLLKGVALFRSGNFALAAETIESIKAPAEDIAPWRELFLALLDQRAGRHDEAKSHLKRAISRMNDNETQTRERLTWPDRLELQLLQAEVESSQKPQNIP